MQRALHVWCGNGGLLYGLGCSRFELTRTDGLAGMSGGGLLEDPDSPSTSPYVYG